MHVCVTKQTQNNLAFKELSCALTRTLLFVEEFRISKIHCPYKDVMCTVWVSFYLLKHTWSNRRYRKECIKQINSAES